MVGVVVGVDVVSVAGWVVAVSSMNSGSTRITVGEATVVVVCGELVAAAAATVVGISMDGWITRFRTWDTAPHEKATATTAAIAHPPTSFIQFGMFQLSQLLRYAKHQQWLGLCKVRRNGPGVAPDGYRIVGMSSVLIIEDDPAIRQGLATFLAEDGHSVESLASGMDGVQRAAEGGFDVVVLDLGLPDIDGIQVLKMIRAVSDVPIVVATARDEESEIVRVLRDGADDYVVKPFSGAQLQARIEAIMRRVSGGGARGPLVVGNLSVDIERREAALDGGTLDLTRKEFDLLAYLAERAGVVVSKRELLAEVWRQPYGGADKTVDVHLSVLRRKLGETAADARYLQTVHGVGIKLVAPDS